VIVKPLPVSDTVVSNFLSNRQHFKSCIIATIGTYHGAFVIIRNTFNLNLSRISILDFDADPHNCKP